MSDLGKVPLDWKVADVYRAVGVDPKKATEADKRLAERTCLMLNGRVDHRYGKEVLWALQSAGVDTAQPVEEDEFQAEWLRLVTVMTRGIMLIFGLGLVMFVVGMAMSNEPLVDTSSDVMMWIALWFGGYVSGFHLNMGLR